MTHPVQNTWRQVYRGTVLRRAYPASMMSRRGLAVLVTLTLRRGRAGDRAASPSPCLCWRY